MLWRNLAAMATEEMIRGNPIDGVVLLGGCDKTIPSLLMGATSVNLPAIIVPGGPMLNGTFKGKMLGCGTDVWRFSADVRSGKMSQEDFNASERSMIRSKGHCNTMGTASTMGCIAEALGMTLPGLAGTPAADSRLLQASHDSGRRIVEMVKEDLKPQDILTFAAFSNAIVALGAIGGSTNAVVHLLAIAGRAGVELTLDDINGIRRDAVEGTRREVNKTLFTIIRKSNAGEKMRYIMPFFNAWENSMRRWSGLVKENPAVAARAGQIVSSLRNQPNMVDGDGNPTDKFSFDNKLVVPMPETFIKALPKSMQEAIRSTGTQVSIPIRSLDLIFQGELIAGFGPVVAIPASEIVKLRPELEDVFKPILPFGPSENILKQIIPPAAQKLFSRAFQDEQWSRTFNTVYRYELIRYKLGERDSEPTVDEVQKLTNSMYTIKMFSNLTLPFAAQYDSPLSWYTQQFRKLQQTHGGDADALFPLLARSTLITGGNGNIARLQCDRGIARQKRGCRLDIA
jgi:hypothetical protein